MPFAKLSDVLPHFAPIAPPPAAQDGGAEAFFTYSEVRDPPGAYAHLADVAKALQKLRSGAVARVHCVLSPRRGARWVFCPRGVRVVVTTRTVGGAVDSIGPLDSLDSLEPHGHVKVWA